MHIRSLTQGDRTFREVDLGPSWTRGLIFQPIATALIFVELVFLVLRFPSYILSSMTIIAVIVALIIQSALFCRITGLYRKSEAGQDVIRDREFDGVCIMLVIFLAVVVVITLIYGHIWDIQAEDTSNWRHEPVAMSPTTPMDLWTGGVVESYPRLSTDATRYDEPGDLPSTHSSTEHTRNKQLPEQSGDFVSSLSAMAPKQNLFPSRSATRMSPQTVLGEKRLECPVCMNREPIHPLGKGEESINWSTIPCGHVICTTYVLDLSTILVLYVLTNRLRCIHKIIKPTSAGKCPVCRDRVETADIREVSLGSTGQELTIIKTV